MSMIAILDYPSKRLQKKGEFVENPLSDDIKKIIEDMFETLYGTANCVGLAATQLDYQNPKAITVIDVSESRDEPYCLINPKILEGKGETYEPEGCMSVFPKSIKAPVIRFETVKVEFLDETGEIKVLDADGFLAKCIQHEIDHLNGKLFVDYVEGVKWKILERKISKAMLKKNKKN